jgi:3-hydroxyisobutyrate dehydrogenase-like beta-hydroxyacid dehydrogenase
VGKRFGLSPSVMLEVINQSSGANNSTQNKLAQRVLSRSFDAGFTIGLMTKDLTTARDLAREVGVDVPPVGPDGRAVERGARRARSRRRPHGDREVVRGQPRPYPRRPALNAMIHP